MANMRDPDKRLIGVYVDKDVKQTLVDLAKRETQGDLTAFCTKLFNEAIGQRKRRRRTT